MRFRQAWPSSHLIITWKWKYTYIVPTVRMEAQEKWMITSLVPNYGNFSLRER